MQTNKLKVFAPKCVAAVYAALAGLMLIGTFWDYQINTVLYFPESLLARGVDHLGTYPLTLCLVSSLALFLRLVLSKPHDYILIPFFLFNILAAGFSLIVLYYYHPSPVKASVGTVFAIGFAAFIFVKLNVTETRSWYGESPYLCCSLPRFSFSWSTVS